MEYIFAIIFTIFMLSVSFGFLLYAYTKFIECLPWAVLICFLCITIDLMVWLQIIFKNGL